MNSQQAREFRERWQAVAAIEAKEQEESSIALRWQQTNAILRLAMDLGLSMSKTDDAETQAIIHRWVRLKEAAT